MKIVPAKKIAVISANVPMVFVNVCLDMPVCLVPKHACVVTVKMVLVKKDRTYVVVTKDSKDRNAMKENVRLVKRMAKNAMAKVSVTRREIASVNLNLVVKPATN